MFEGDNISRLWIPSLCKLCCSCWCYKSNPIWPIIGKMWILDWEIIQGLLQFAFPGSRRRFCNNLRLSVSIFLLWRKKKDEQGLHKYYKMVGMLPCVWGSLWIYLIEKDLKDLARWFLLLLDPWYPEISSQGVLYLYIKYREQFEWIDDSFHWVLVLICECVTTIVVNAEMWPYVIVDISPDSFF